MNASGELHKLIGVQVQEPGMPKITISEAASKAFAAVVADAGGACGQSRYSGLSTNPPSRVALELRIQPTKENSMSSHPAEFQGSVVDALREAIERQIPDSRADVNGGGGHFNIEVTSPVFAGKNMLESQRMVYGAIANLMKGDRAPVHAVDSLKTRTPTE